MRRSGNARVRRAAAVFGSLPASACTLGTTSQTYGPDRIARNIYDAAGQLLQVQRAYGITTANGFPATLQQNYATYTYSLNGQRTSVTDANGNRAELTYDGFDRQRRWIFPSPTTPGAVNQADYEEYGYDAVGNRTSVRKRDGSTLTFQYDNLNRMIVKIVPERAGLSSTHTRDVHYGYDLRNLPTYARFDSPSGEGVATPMTRSGNRRTGLTHPDGQPFTYGYSPADELTGVYLGVGTSVVLEQFTHDPQARLASRVEGPGSSVVYTYDSVGRLATMTDAFAGGTGNVALTFGYNPAGQITQRTRNNDAYASNTAYNVSRGYTVNGLNQYSAAGGTNFGYGASGNLISDGMRTFTYDVENRLVAASGGRGLAYFTGGAFRR